MRRAILIEGLGVEFEVSKFTVVHVHKRFFHLDELEDGTWRIQVSSAFFEHLDRLESISLLEMGKAKSFHAVWKGIGYITHIHKTVKLPTSTKARGLIHFEQIEFDNWKLLVGLQNNLEYKLQDITGLKIIRED